MLELLQIAAFVAFNGIIVLFAVGAVLQSRENHMQRSIESIRTSVSGRGMTPAADRSPSRRTRTEHIRDRVN